MNVTINDVAKAAGVSTATISRFFNDRSRVKEETAQIVEQVIKDLNYVPNSIARSLVIMQSNTIGILISQFNSIYWSEVHSTIHGYLSQHTKGMEVAAVNCDDTVLFYSNKSVKDKIKYLAEQRAIGVICLLRDLSDDDVNYLCNFDIPFVVVQSDSTDERISSINIDNYTATHEITQHMLDLGHKHIVYISGPSDAVFSHERFEGFRDAMISKQLYRKNMILQGDTSVSDGYWRTKQILASNPLLTAIIYATDSMAFGGMRAIGEAGLRIPEDISIAGFDGMREQVEILDMLPPLTTVVQPINSIGEKAAEIMLRKIQDKKMGLDKRYNIVLPTEFVDNGSCAPPRIR